MISDFDGTVCQVNVGKEVMKRFTRENRKGQDYEDLKRSRGSRAAYEQTFPLIKGSREDMHRFALAKGKLTRGFLQFHRLCRKRGLDVMILSDGMDFYIRDILESKGFKDIECHSNVVEFGEEESVSISFPEMNEMCGRCGTCKNAILQSFRLIYEQIIYIGDGQSDWCPSRYADLVFAKGVLFTQYRQDNLPCVPFDDFTTINRYLKDHF